MSENWLATHLKTLPVSAELREVMQSRGISRAYEDLGIKSWENLGEPAPCPKFQAMFDSKGSKLADCLITPLLSLRGQLLGFEARKLREKKIFKYLLPNANWNPIWIGITATNIRALWERKPILWLVEGVYDLLTLLEQVPNNPVVLASGRANLTPSQLIFLQRFSCRVLVTYDNDPTGQKGTASVCQRLTQAGLQAIPVTYSGGKDPNEVLLKFGTLFPEHFPINLGC